MTLPTRFFEYGVWPPSNCVGTYAICRELGQTIVSTYNHSHPKVIMVLNYEAPDDELEHVISEAIRIIRSEAP